MRLEVSFHGVVVWERGIRPPGWKGRDRRLGGSLGGVKESLDRKLSGSYLVIRRFNERGQL
jgi:hypothetical protein